MTHATPSVRPGELPRLIQRAIRLPKETESPTRSMALFREKYIGHAKEDQIIQYMKEYPDNSPISRNLSASLLWLFLSNGDNREGDITYFPTMASWYLYWSHCCEQTDALPRLTPPIQASLSKCVQLAKRVESPRNSFKNLADRDVRPRR